MGSITGTGGPNYLGGAYGISVSGKYAYVADYATPLSGDNTFAIFDISNPASPVLAGSITGAGQPNYLGGGRAVFVSGNYAYLACDVDNAFTIFDISNPANPVHKGSITGYLSPNYLAGVDSVFVSGKYAYVCSAEMMPS